MTYKEIEGKLPEKVFTFFREICEIPRESGNTKEVSDYCVEFARKRNLYVRQDAANNVIIKKPGTHGKEKAPVVMLQGHLDMVCVSEPGVDHDFLREGISLKVEGDFLSGEGTTLGGDDGIAIAYALAVLDSEDIPHPPLECVFTSDEEIGMVGAAAMDFSDLHASYLINLDSEEEGSLLVGCAGGIRYDIRIPMQSELIKREAISDRDTFALEISHLAGGHSGADIHLDRANANILMGRVLKELYDNIPELRILRGFGGKQDNAIPSECTFFIRIPGAREEKAREIVEDTERVLLKEYPLSEPNLSLVLRTVKGETEPEDMMTEHTASSTEKVIRFLLTCPNGVVRMNQYLPTLVETSLNLGILSVDAGEMRVSYLLRSNVGSGKDALRKSLEALIEVFGGQYSTSGDYPEWEFSPESKLLDLMKAIFEEKYEKEARVETIHAGVECGLFVAGVQGLQAVSIGPDIFDVHSPKERLSMSSASRVWEYLLEVLKRIS